MPVQLINTNSGGGSDLYGAATLAGLFLGKSQTTSGSSTSTVQNEVSPEAVDAVVKNILQGSQGLAAVAGGQNQAGLYNSSTRQMQVNDLLARTAGEAAKLNSSQTTSNNTSGTVKTPAQVSPSNAALALGGMQVLGTLGRTSFGQKLMSAVNPFGSTSNSASAPIRTPTEQDVLDNINAHPDTADATPSVGNTVDSSGSTITPSGAAPSAGFDTSNINGLDLGAPDLSASITGDIGGNIITADSGGSSDASFGDTSGVDFSGASNANGGDWGPDPSSINYTDNNTDFSDLFSFAEGGYVTAKGNDSLLSRAASGLANPAAEAAFSSGGDDKSPAPQAQKTSMPAGDPTPSYGSGNMGAKIITFIRNKLNEGKPGYATGGLVDLTNTGLRVSGDSSDSVANAMNPTSSTQTVTGSRRSSSSNGGGNGNNSGAAGNSDGSGASADASGPTASAGISAPGLGTVGSAVGAVAGLGGLGSVAGAIGNNSNASAVGGTVGGIAGVVASAITGNPVVGMVVSSLVNHSVGQGDSSSTPGSVAASNANNAADNNGMDPMDAMVAMLGATSSNQGITPGTVNANGASVGSGSGPAGVSTDGGVGVGDSSGNSVGSDGDGGVGAGGAMASGGSVKGPGTSTSDSIDAKLSDGEYVLNAHATAALGKDTLDWINNTFKPSTNQLAQGAAVRMSERGYS